MYTQDPQPLPKKGRPRAFSMSQQPRRLRKGRSNSWPVITSATASGRLKRPWGDGEKTGGGADAGQAGRGAGDGRRGAGAQGQASRCGL